MKKVFKILLFAAGMPLAMSAQQEGPAGADKLLCPGGSTRLGPQTPCTDCCYLWSPEHHLDDPNAPNPTVSGLSESTIYAVTVSMPDGNYETDFVTVYTYSIDMAIFKPKFLSSNPNAGEQMVSESQEESPGAQTMVNIDNDDCDDQFDKEDLLVTGGDDEFVKLRVRMTVDLPMFANMPGSAQRLPPFEFKAVVLANNGLSEGVLLWRSNDKSAGIYNLGDELVLTAAGENAYEAFVWVEGIKGHNAPRQAQFKARAIGNEAAGCMNEDVVALTVVGVDKTEWVGQENGYTGDGKNNSNALDDVGGPARTQRAFPEGKLNGNTVSSAKTTVTAVVTLSTPVVEALPLYLRTFDVDDPSDETSVIDPNDLGNAGIYQGSQGLNYDPDNDNRGMVATSGSIDPSNPGASSAKFGAFSGNGLSVTDAANGIYKQTVTVPQKMLSANFEVAKYPGDNYRFAVYGDLDFLKKLRNRDQYDKHKLVDRCTGVNEGCKEIDQKYESPILAVWRTLHIEHDLMRRANDNPGNENQELRYAYFTDFELDGGGPKISAIKNVLNEDGTFALLNDGSISPPERFEGGAIKLGNKPFSDKCHYSPSTEGYVLYRQRCQFKTLGKR